MKGLLALFVLSAFPALASVQSALSANVLPSSANLSSYSITLAELKAADVACEEGWAAVDSAAALAARGRELRAGLIAAVGGFPETRCALNAQTVATVQRDGYKVEKVLFESWPGVHVTANFFLPDNPSFAAPYPAVILPCGHSTNGKGSDAYQRGCVLAAKVGLACLIYDPFDQGERYQTSRRNSCADHNRVGALAALLGGSMARFRIWDGMRAIDYLESRSDVDSSRIGCMGNSGGGTMTSLLMSVEPRLKAACPSCYISTFRAVVESIGPQDAEQNVFGQLPLGVNHASFAFLQAPMPVRFMFCRGDMFPFSGSQVTWNVVSNTAERCGLAGRYAMTDADGEHGWKESTRVSSVEWLRRWLCDEPSAITHDVAGYRALDAGFNLNSVDTALSGTAHEVCSGGSVLNLPGERTVYDLMRDELADAIAAQGRSIPPERVRAVAGIAEPETAGVVGAVVSRGAESGCELVRESFTWPNGFAVPAVTFTPPEASGAPVLIVGNGARKDRAALAETWIAQGRSVTVADVIGTGEVGGMKHSFYSTDVPEEEVAVMLYLLGRSLVGEQAGEILAIARELKARTGLAPEIVAKGRVCIAAVHARAARRDLVAQVTQVSPPPSWTESVSQGASIPFATVVNGALKHYDWTSLLDRVAKDVGTLSISVRAGVDWRSADVSTTVSELSLPCSDSAQLTVTACGADGREVARAVFPVVENGVYSLSVEGLTAGALYTFRAVLAVEDAAAAGGENVIAETAVAEAIGRRQNGWIDEDIATLRGASAGRWTYDAADVFEAALGGEPAIGITAQNGEVAFSPSNVVGSSYVVNQRVCFAGPVGTYLDPAVASAKAAVALVPWKGGTCRFALLDNGAWHINTEVVAELDATYDIRIQIDPARRGVAYEWAREDGSPVLLHSGTYRDDGALPPRQLAYRGSGRVRSIDGEVYNANLAAVGDEEYDSVSNALEHAQGRAVRLLHDATYAPDPNGEFRIDAAGYTLVLTGGDYGAFAGWAKRHPEVLDGSRSVSAKSARVSSALDLDGLVPDETLDALRQSGVRITRAAFAGGVVEITLKVDDLPVGEAAQMEHVKRIFGIIGSQGGDAPFLADEVVQVSEPVRDEDGTVRFRVRPAVSPAPKRFFFRGKIDLTAGNTISYP